MKEITIDFILKDKKINVNEIEAFHEAIFEEFHGRICLCIKVVISQLKDVRKFVDHMDKSHRSFYGWQKSNGPYLCVYLSITNLF